MQTYLKTIDLVSLCSQRQTANGEAISAPIDDLLALPLSAVVANRVRRLKRSMTPMVEDYFESFKQAQSTYQAKLLALKQQHAVDIKKATDHNDQTESIDDQYALDTQALTLRTNADIEALLNEPVEINYTPIVLSDLMIDPTLEDAENIKTNWHPIKGAYLDLLSWFIVDDLDGGNDSEKVSEADIQADTALLIQQVG